MNITLTASARDYIAAAMQKQNGVGFRLSIKKTGCSGYAYQPSVVDAVPASHECITIDGIALYIDPVWAHLLTDIRIDLVEDMKSGLKQKRLTIENQKEAGRCGCGESFHLDKQE